LLSYHVTSFGVSGPISGRSHTPILLDARFRTALHDDGAARGLLAELHQKILTCRDSHLLPELLGQYVTLATARGQMTTIISQVMKTAHDTATAITHNLRS